LSLKNKHSLRNETNQEGYNNKKQNAIATYDRNQDAILSKSSEYIKTLWGV